MRDRIAHQIFPGELLAAGFGFAIMSITFLSLGLGSTHRTLTPVIIGGGSFGIITGTILFAIKHSYKNIRYAQLTYWFALGSVLGCMSASSYNLLNAGTARWDVFCGIALWVTLWFTVVLAKSFGDKSFDPDFLRSQRRIAD